MDRLIAAIVALAGFTITAQWLEYMMPLTQIGQDSVTMKITTSVGFALVGLMLLVGRRRKATQVALALTLFGLVCTAVLFAILEVSMGLDKSDFMTPIKGVPSLGTMISFALLGCYGLFEYRKKLRWVPVVIGVGVCSVALVAVIGYVIGRPSLYYYIPQHSTAMAIHTAVLFFLSGFTCLLQVYQRKLSGDGRR